MGFNLCLLNEELDWSWFVLRHEFQELTKLSQKFNENILGATKFEKLIIDKKDIEGLLAIALRLSAQKYNIIPRHFFKFSLSNSVFREMGFL